MPYAPKMRIKTANAHTAASQDTLFWERRSRKGSSFPSLLITNTNTAAHRTTPRSNSVIPNDGSVTAIMDSAFAGCANLTEIVIPQSVISIGEYAFAGCSGLTEIKIPGSVSKIGYNSFSWCDNLSSVVISDGVTNIGPGAFQQNFNLTSVIIPASVTAIDNAAFYQCPALTDVYFTGTQNEWNVLKWNIGMNNNELKNATVHYNYVAD